MAGFVKGDVVVVPFPFSDLTQSKRRPALVLAALTGDDLILCQVTTQASRDAYSIPLSASDFAEGGLKHASYIRPNRLFAADSHIVLYRAGRLKPETLRAATDAVVQILRQ